MAGSKLSSRDWRAIMAKLEAGKPFATHGALRGVTGRAVSMGALSREHMDSAREAEYTVMSYATPIAWRVAGRWMMPETRHSATTDRHQRVVRIALGQLGEEPHDA